MARSLPQSKPPEAEGLCVSEPLLPTWASWAGWQIPEAPSAQPGRPQWQEVHRPCLSWPQSWGRALLSSDEHIHPPKLSSCVHLPRKISHQTVCRLPCSRPVVLWQCLLPCLSARKTGPPTSFISRASGWLGRSVLSVDLWNQVQSRGSKSHLLLNASLGPQRRPLPSPGALLAPPMKTPCRLIHLYCS